MPIAYNYSRMLREAALLPWGGVASFAACPMRKALSFPFPIGFVSLATRGATDFLIGADACNPACRARLTHEIHAP